MSKKGKKYQEVEKLVDRAKIYTLDEAVSFAAQTEDGQVR